MRKYNKSVILLVILQQLVKCVKCKDDQYNYLLCFNCEHFLLKFEVLFPVEKTDTYPKLNYEQQSKIIFAIFRFKMVSDKIIEMF